MEENFSFKNVSRDYSSNFQVIMWIMELTNNSFASLENLFYQLQNNSKELFKEVYINLLKLLLFNIPLYIIISYGTKNIDFRYLAVLGLWAFVLLQYPPFKAFIMILGKLVISLINFLYQSLLQNFFLIIIMIFIILGTEKMEKN